MVNKIYLLLITIFVASTTLFASITFPIDTSKVKINSELTPDDPILSMIDSIMVSGYFESLGFHDNFTKSNRYKYALDSVPQFDSLTYAKRFKKLDVNSPFKLVYNGYTKAYVNLYAKRRKKITAKMLGLAPLYFPVFEASLDKYNLPLELKYLPIIESALNPKAKSQVGATGLWQFMYETGKMYGLEVTSYYDERGDLYKATDAACRYLKSLFEMYNDWDLALAAYNCGPGNVNKAIRRSGGKTSFWEIMPFLPRETSGYVPAFMAVNYVMNYAAEHNIQPVKPEFPCLKVDTVGINSQITFSQLSKALDIPIKYLEYINPTYKQNLIPANGKPNTLCLPADKIGMFLTNENKIYTQNETIDLKNEVAQNVTVEPKRSEAIVYKVKSGDGLTKIAQKYHCRSIQIKEWNNLRNDRLNVGQVLYLYPKASYVAQIKKQEQVETQMTATKASTDGKFVYYTVKAGDNLYRIASKFENTSVDQILKLNKGLTPKSLRQGTKIKIKPVG